MGCRCVVTCVGLHMRMPPFPRRSRSGDQASKQHPTALLPQTSRGQEIKQDRSGLCSMVTEAHNRCSTCHPELPLPIFVFEGSAIGLMSDGTIHTVKPLRHVCPLTDPAQTERASKQTGKSPEHCKRSPWRFQTRVPCTMHIPDSCTRFNLTGRDMLFVT